jgi:anti-sigma factor RsiW
MNDEEVPHTCQETIGLIVRGADGTLEPAERARLDAHLTACARCRQSFEGQQRARRALMAWTSEPAAPDFAARVLARIPRPESWLDGWDFRRWTWRMAPVAAGMAIAVFVVAGRADLVSASQDNSMSSASELTVAASLGSDDLSQSDVLALLLTADADDTLVEALEEISQ